MSAPQVPLLVWLVLGLGVSLALHGAVFAYAIFGFLGGYAARAIADLIVERYGHPYVVYPVVLGATFILMTVPL